MLKLDSEWGCLLQVFGSFAILDENFYDGSIFTMVNELKIFGVMVDFEDACKEFTLTFKQQASLGSNRKENALTFLAAYRKLKKLEVKLPSDLENCVCHEKWLRTRLGDYRSPNDCILSGTDWEPITLITLLPFIDDSSTFYGSGIHDYHDELKQLGVISDFKDGAQFVAAGLFLPSDSSSITPENVYPLLDSVKKLKEREDIPPKFFEKMSHKNWLKTIFGYRRPNECLLFDSAWDPFLKCNDGPFIDVEFYKTSINLYKEQLGFLGVITEVSMGCQLLASYVNFHTSFEAIGRIYNYLLKFKWVPNDEDSRKIWISRGTNNGDWVMPQDCVLYDNNNLFGKQLEVLEKCKYDKTLLNFFADVFDVKVHPSVDDYCKLWRTWESSGHRITHAECCAFWEFLVRNWNPIMEETFRKNLLKLPVLDPTSDEIILLDKHDVFIGDDLFLMDLFQRSSRPIFVWYPQQVGLKTPTRTELVDVYTKLGARTVSVSAQKMVSDVGIVGFEPVNPREKIITRGLFKLILGFLADPNLKLEAVRRHEAVSRVLAIEAFETAEPERMTVRYRLSFSSGDVEEEEATQMIRWEKQKSKFFMQKMERGCCGHKQVLEYASDFAKVIGDGVLWEKEEVVPQLSELIMLGFLFEFDEEAVDLLMKMKNLEIFVEDQEYLSSTFSL